MNYTIENKYLSLQFMRTYRKYIIKIICFFLCCFSTISLYSFVIPPSNVLKTIVIDAGHGGKDSGAPGSFSFEKNVCLNIALKLRVAIEKQFPNIQVVLTRSVDSFVELKDRAIIANKAHADLFISIHANSADPIYHQKFERYKTIVYYKGKGKNRKKITRQMPVYKTWTTPNSTEGTETYVWLPRKNTAKELAILNTSLNNFDIDTSDTDSTAYVAPQASSPELSILSRILMKQYFERSTNLAMIVEDEFKKEGRISREARQRDKGIWVLEATAMPSVLIEVGYMSNEEEEKYINSEKGQDEITHAIVEALKRYKYYLLHPNLPIQFTNIPNVKDTITTPIIDTIHPIIDTTDN